MSNQESGGLQVSVVMAVFNGERTLEATLASVLEQSGCTFEFIVIDDGSTDRTSGILDDWAAKDSRLRVFHKENQGLTRALIAGCLMARGDWIARQDCGDTSRPMRLAKQLDRLRVEVDAVICGCDYHVVGPGGEPMYSVNRYDSSTADLLTSSGGLTCAPHHGSAMFRRDAYLKVGQYRAVFRYAQDIDLWSRMLEIGQIAWIDEPLYEVRFELDSITGRHQPKQQALREIILQASRARAQGKSEDEFLQRASEISGAKLAKRRSTRSRVNSAAAYFVGSCLFDRRDRRARRYLWQALLSSPRHYRAIPKLLISYAWPRSVSQAR